DLATRQDQLLRDAEAADARESLCAAPTRDDAEVDLRLAEPCVARGVAQVAAECELATTAEREAVDRGDRRLRHLLEHARRLVAEGTPLLRLARSEAAHVLDVGPGDEGAVAGAGEDDGVRRLVLGELVQTIAELRQRLDVERVQRLLPVDRDDGDRVVTVDEDGHAATAPFRKSTISVVGAPGPKTPATPSLRSSSASSSGIVPPTTTTTSSTPF